MKYLIIAGSILFTSTSANALNEDHAVCLQMSEMAGLLMEQRQKGVAINSLIEAIQKTGMSDMAKTGFSIVAIDYYDTPIFADPNEKQQIVNYAKFSFYNECMITE